MAEPLVRPAGPGDAPAISAVRRASWLAAYDGLIEPGVLRRAAARPATRPAAPYRQTLVAVAGEPPQVIGYASHGPERWWPLPQSHSLVAGAAAAAPPRASPARVPARPAHPGRPGGRDR